MLDSRFNTIIGLLTATNTLAIDATQQSGLDINEQQKQIERVKQQIHEEKAAITREISTATPKLAALLHESSEACLAVLETIALFSEPNKDKKPLLDNEYKDTIALSLEDAQKKVLNIVSQLTLYNEIPIHEKTSRYIYELLEDAAKLTVDSIKASTSEERMALHEKYSQATIEKLDNVFQPLFSPSGYDGYKRTIARNIRKANPELGENELNEIIEKEVKEGIRSAEEIREALGKHAKEFSTTEQSAEQLGKEVMKEILLLENMLVKTSAARIAEYTIKEAGKKKTNFFKQIKKSFAQLKEKFAQLKERFTHSGDKKVSTTSQVGSLPFTQVSDNLPREEHKEEKSHHKSNDFLKAGKEALASLTKTINKRENSFLTKLKANASDKKSKETPVSRKSSANEPLKPKKEFSEKSTASRTPQSKETSVSVEPISQGKSKGK